MPSLELCLKISSGFRKKEWPTFKQTKVVLLIPPFQLLRWIVIVVHRGHSREQTDEHIHQWKEKRLKINWWLQRSTNAALLHPLRANRLISIHQRTARALAAWYQCCLLCGFPVILSKWIVGFWNWAHFAMKLDSFCPEVRWILAPFVFGVWFKLA